MKAKTFEREFDEGRNIASALDLTKAGRPLQEQKRVNVDFPAWMVERLDKEAKRVGVTRQSIIKVWLAERLEHTSPNKSLNADTGSPCRLTNTLCCNDTIGRLERFQRIGENV